MLKTTVLAALAASIVFAKPADDRLQRAAETLNEIMATPDKGIPQDLFEKAECVVVIPGVKKAAFVVGGEYGAGYAECRRNGAWSGPAAVKIKGGSVGWQIGGESTDLVLLVMNEHGMRSLMSDKFTMGADASVAAGPVGRTAAAQTDAKLNAEILAWSRSKGAFAGIALNGAVLSPNSDEDRKLYGRDVTNREILSGTVPAPAGADVLTAALNTHAGGNADRSK